MGKLQIVGITRHDTPCELSTRSSYQVRHSIPYPANLGYAADLATHGGTIMFMELFCQAI